MDERDALRAWLKRCAPILEDRTSDEVAHLAILCGFNLEQTCEVLAHWIMDRQTRTNYRTREAWFVDRELEAAIQPDRFLSLKTRWYELANYERYGEPFEGAA